MYSLANCLEGMGRADPTMVSDRNGIVPINREVDVFYIFTSSINSGCVSRISGFDMACLRVFQAPAQTFVYLISSGVRKLLNVVRGCLINSHFMARKLFEKGTESCVNYFH